MLEIIDGVRITMSKDELDLPHVHASYGSYHGIFSLKTGKVIKGNIPKEKAINVEHWIVLNEEKLMSRWKRIA